MVLWTADAPDYILPDGVEIRTLSLDPARVEITARTCGKGALSAQVLDGDTLLASGKAEGGVVRLTLPGARPWRPPGSTRCWD